MSQAKSNARWALAVFGVLAAVSVPLYLVLGRHEWFFLDEWDFLADRTAWNVGDLLRPHTDHWTTLPILVWRALWQVAGVRSYLPYEALSVLAHVAVAALVRAVMRRAGVGPWVATVAAGTFLFFGAGAENIMYAFQITFTGALAFGFAQLLLADHDGPLDRRDWLGLLAGLLGLMCSGVAVAMVAVVGLATWIRRGPRAAAFHVVPLAAIYLLWWVRYARSATDVIGNVRSILDFVRDGIATVFSSLGHVIGLGVVLAAVLVVGFVLVWRDSDAADRRTRLAAPASLAAGAVLFLLLTGVGRTSVQRVIDDPAASRYQYVSAALLLPAIAVAIEAVYQRRRVVGIAALALLVVGVPGNLIDASHFGRGREGVTARSREVMLSIGRARRAEEAPGDLKPDPIGAPWVTMAWIRAGVRSGRIPAPSSPPDARLRATDGLRLSLMQIDTPRGRSCPPLTRPVDRRLGRGDRLKLGNGAVAVRSLTRSGPRGTTVSFGNALFGAGPSDHELVALVPLRVRVTPIPGRPAYLC